MTDRIKVLGIELDRYVTQARVLPMFIVLAPLATVAGAWTPGLLSIATGAGGLAVLGGASFFLSQIARSAGKQKEKALWESWGGSPTVRCLRHRDGGYNSDVRGRCHKALAQLGHHVPTAEEEEADRAAADEAYSSCTKTLIIKTRDTERFPLVFKENINYGFLRNLWALKPLGISLSVLALLLCLVRAWLAWRSTKALDEAAAVGALLDAGLLVAWWLWITRDSIHVAAVAYAERLLEACLTLETSAAS